MVCATDISEVPLQHRRMMADRVVGLKLQELEKIFRLNLVWQLINVFYI